jgi:phosphoribosylformylglycinamidine (FGAM) synthase-like enzyme
MASGLGATLEAPQGVAAHAFWFGEDQGRYIVTATQAQLAALVEAAQVAGVAVKRIGTVGGQSLTLGSETPVAVADLTTRFEAWLPDYMAGKVDG